MHLNLVIRASIFRGGAKNYSVGPNFSGVTSSIRYIFWYVALPTTVLSRRAVKRWNMSKVVDGLDTKQVTSYIANESGKYGDSVHKGVRRDFHLQSKLREHEDVHYRPNLDWPNFLLHTDVVITLKFKAKNENTKKTR